MEQCELEVLLRKESGKGPARRLRREGRIPAVLYGPRTDPVLLSLQQEDLRSALRTAAGGNALIFLRAKNDPEVSDKVVMLKDLQVDPLTRKFLHADLYELVMDEEIEVEVPIHLRGNSIGVQEGGILQQVSRELRVRCLPKDIPEGIEIDINELKIGDSIHVRDIPLKEGVEIIAESDFTVLTVLAPAVEEEPEAVVEEKPAEAEEKPGAEAEEKPGAAAEEKPEGVVEEKPAAVKKGKGAKKKE